MRLRIGERRAHVNEAAIERVPRVIVDRVEGPAIRQAGARALAVENRRVVLGTGGLQELAVGFAIVAAGLAASWPGSRTKLLRCLQVDGILRLAMAACDRVAGWFVRVTRSQGWPS